jgi:hypothetical protein
MVPLGRVMFPGLMGVMTLGLMLDRVQRCMGYVSHRKCTPQARQDEK